MEAATPAPSATDQPVDWFANLDEQVDKTVMTSNVCKTYVMGEERVQALDNVSLSINAGEYISIMGIYAK